MRRWWLDTALIGGVLALGLLQGARAALGGVAFEPAPPPPARSETPAEAEAARGRFYRPQGSTAERPALRLQPLLWRPPSEQRVALSCTDAGC